MIAIMMTRNPPTTAAISTVMLSVSAARPFLECALVLDSEREELSLKELSHPILSYFGQVQNDLQIEGNLRIVVY